jgi:hypothetical protein
MPAKNPPKLADPEKQGEKLRQLMGLSESASLDPFNLARLLHVHVFYPSSIPGIPTWVLDHLLFRRPLSWSAATYMTRGNTFVLLNPTHSRARINASLMEEIAHIYLKHDPIILQEDGSQQSREFREDEEAEAYATGAAALVPCSGLRQFLFSEPSLSSIAENYGVTKELIEYRLKVTGLWHVWLKLLRNRNGELFSTNKIGMLVPSITE